MAADHTAGIERLAEDYLGDRSSLKAISRKELADRLERGDLVVLDVRPEAEFRAGHIAGARSVPITELRQSIRVPEAIHIELGDTAKQASNLPTGPLH